MQVKQHRSTGFDDIVQRPCITPAEEAWRGLDRIEGRSDVRDDPEYKPESCPRHADDHGDVLASHAESYHATTSGVSKKHVL